MNWRRYLKSTERSQLNRWERQLVGLTEQIRAIRVLRRLLQNRAYARGKK